MTVAQSEKHASIDLFIAQRCQLSKRQVSGAVDKMLVQRETPSEIAIH